MNLAHVTQRRVGRGSILVGTVCLSEMLRHHAAHVAEVLVVIRKLPEDKTLVVVLEIPLGIVKRLTSLTPASDPNGNICCEEKATHRLCHHACRYCFAPKCNTKTHTMQANRDQIFPPNHSNASSTTADAGCPFATSTSSCAQLSLAS